jgi:hypothetical protein
MVCHLGPSSLSEIFGKLAESVFYGTFGDAVKHGSPRRGPDATLAYTLAKAFLLEDGGMDGAFRRIFLRPNPNFSHAPLNNEWYMPWPVPFCYRLKRFVYTPLRHDWTKKSRSVSDLSRDSTQMAKYRMTREEQRTDEWKTTHLQTAPDGRVIFLKTISLRQNTVHRNFKPIPKLSVPPSVSLVTRNSGS